MTFLRPLIMCSSLIQHRIGMFLVLFSLHFVLLSSQKEKSLLWKIEGPENIVPSFLFGTIHMIPAQDFIIDKKTDSVFRLSQKVVFEMDISDPTLQLKVLRYMMLDSGKTLESLYSPRDFRKIKKALQKQNIQIEIYARFMPIVVQQNVILKHIMGTDIKSYELHFLSWAKENNKPVVGLEKIEDQINALKSIPLDKQADMMKGSILRPKKSKKELLRLIKYYKKGDLERMIKIFMKDEKIEEGREALLLNRNKSWIEPLKEMMREGSVFVAVGAAHLGGEFGLIELIRKQGYKVVPVR